MINSWASENYNGTRKDHCNVQEQKIKYNFHLKIMIQILLANTTISLYT